MGHKYKLKFGDGTTLALDLAGLKTWISGGKVDAHTTVQSPGKKGWLPLPQFVAGEGSSPRPQGVGGPAPEPSLRLAPLADEPEPDEDVYDGDVESDGPLAVAWMWAKRLVLVLVVLMGLGSAVAWWPAWLPWARERALPFITEHGVRLFNAIDRRVHPERASRPPSAQSEREQRVAVAREAAAAQLPQLEAATIDRVIASSLLDAVEPPEVFSRAHEAIARGLPFLGPDDAAELRGLKARLLAALPPAERERLAEYDRMRAHRSTLPFEDREAMVLTARGFRGLPAVERERLRALGSRAANAGLATR
jgi:hypothetical protein